MPETDAPAGGGPEEEPATKQAVYETAVRLFARNGYAATGMRELSREAGVNLATVNYFYGSKKGLLKAILKDYFTGVKAVVDESFAGDDAPDVKLRRLIMGQARYFQSERDKLIIALAELPHDDTDITEFKADWFGRAQEIMRAELGDVADNIPINIVIPAMVGMAASRFLFMPILEKALPPDSPALGGADYPELIAELFINGLGSLLAGGSGEKDD